MLADIHIGQALAAGWDRASRDFDVFSSLFDTSVVKRPFVISPGMVREWYDQLSPDGNPDAVSIIASYLDGRTPPPAWVVSVSDSTPDITEPLGNGSGGVSDVIFWSQVSVYSLALSQELAQCMNVVAGSIISSHYEWLLRDMMYSGIYVSRVGSISPETSFLPEKVSVYRSYISFNLLSHVKFTRIGFPAGVPLRFTVNNVDSFDAYGNAGKANPVSGR